VLQAQSPSSLLLFLVCDGIIALAAVLLHVCDAWWGFAYRGCLLHAAAFVVDFVLQPRNNVFIKLALQLDSPCVVDGMLQALSQGVHSSTLHVHAF
jgi:shikimate 5-dehydrogenase